MVGTLRTDAHIHVYDGRHPTATEAIVHAADASVREYLEAFPSTDRVVVVQPSAYGLDNQCQLDALIEFERHGVTARGVMVVNGDTPLCEIERLHHLGVRGARFHMLPGGSVPWDDLEPVALMIEPFGWHIQLQLNGRELPGRASHLHKLSVPLVIDHVGRFMPPVTVESDEFTALAELLNAGAWVKLSAPYESDADITLIEPVTAALTSRWTDQLVWGSNWPHPGRKRSTPTWHPDGIDDTVLSRNAARLYGF
jgi:D-galactarolactone isomerase